MSALLAHRYWSREDAPGRIAIKQALAGLKVGQRLRLADVLSTVPTEAPEGEERANVPALVDYSSTAIRAGGVDPETRETELSFSSEQPYERWWGIEVLGHNVGEVDMGWLASGRAPLLSDHKRDEQIGVLPRAWIDPSTKKGRAIVRFGRSEQAEEEMQDAQDGVRVNVSVGYEIRELELIKQVGDVSTYRVTDWLPLECSLVSIPADMTVGIGRSVQESPASPSVVHIKTESPKEQPMTQATAEKPLTGDEAFRNNVSAISRLAGAYAKWLKPGDESRAIADGADAQKFQDLIMQRMESGATDVTTSASLGLTPKETRSYSLLRAIQSQLQGLNVDAGLEREVSKEIARITGKEAGGIFVPPDILAAGKRDFNVGTASQAGNLVATGLATDLYTDVLRPALVMGSLGLTILPGLSGNLDIPRKTVAGTLAMLAEIAGAAETQPTTSKTTLSPKRMGAYVEYSKQSVIQGEMGIENMLRSDLLDSAAVLLENQGINGSGSGDNARGIRNVSGIGSVVGGANGLAVNWSHVTGLEASCANANANSTNRAGYLINTKVRNTFKNTQKAANLPFIWDNSAQPLNGYAAAVTNNVPSNLTKGSSSGVCSSLAFSSDWSMFVLGLFGGIDVTVDPFTLAKNAQLVITINQFFDFVCRQPGAFAVMDDALTP